MVDLKKKKKRVLSFVSFENEWNAPLLNMKMFPFLYFPVIDEIVSLMKLSNFVR